MELARTELEMARHVTRRKVKRLREIGRFDKEVQPVFSSAALCHLRGVWSADAMERSVSEETFRDTLVQASSHALTDTELEFSSALGHFHM